MRAQLLLSVGRIHNSNVFKTTIQIDFNPLGRCLLAIDSVLALLFMSDPNKTRVFAACSQSPGIVICLIYAPMHRSQCSDPGLVLAIMEQFITRTSCDMLNFFLFSYSNSPIKGIKVFILFEKVTVNHGLFWGNKTLSNIKIKLETSAHHRSINPDVLFLFQIVLQLPAFMLPIKWFVLSFPSNPVMSAI